MTIYRLSRTRPIRHVVAVIVVVLALVAAACGSDDAGEASDGDTTAPAVTVADTPTEAAAESGDAAPSDDPIVIGHTAGYTGFMSVFDVAVLQGMEFAVADINAAGGVLGRPLEIVTSNNETDFAKLQTSALEVIEAGAQFIVPSCDFDVGSPAARVANEHNIIAIGCAGGPLYGFDGIGPLTYNTYHSSPVEGSLLAEYAADTGITQPFVLIDQTIEYTQSVGETFVARWEELGNSVAGQDIFSSDDDSVAAQISGIRESGADAVVLASFPPYGPSVLLQIRSAGIDLPIFGAQAFDGIYWVDAIPDISNFIIPATASIYGDDPVASRGAFFDRIEAETGVPPANSNYPLSGYASVQSFAIAIERAGTVDTAAVAAELDKFTREDLLIGPTTYTPTCHIPSQRPLLIIEYTDGQPAVIEQRSVKAVAGGAPC